MTSNRKWIAVSGAAVVLGAFAVLLPKLSLFVAVGTLVTFLAAPKLEASTERLVRWAFAVAGVLSLVAVVRFVVSVAVPSLVAAGNDAQALNALTRLRELLVAEDAMRKSARIDPDGDGVGSAALIGELRGSIPLRGRERLDPPLLNDTYAHMENTPLGPAALVSGYFVMVCLPKPGGGFTARPGDPVDEEAAERRFVAYAWPAARKFGPQRAYCIDEHDRILVSDNRAGKEPRYASAGFPPPCDAAIAPETARDWKAWRGKRPRGSLPGAR
jgi:hypothetical protein